MRICSYCFSGRGILPLAAAVFFSFSGAVFGTFSIEPATVTLEINRGEKSAWLDVVHTGGGPMAVEMTVFERNLDLDGEADRDSSVKSNDFIVHPAQIILAPREKAKVQVVYKGPMSNKNAVDKAYFLFSKEVPLKMDDEGEGVRVAINALMNYYTILAISTGKPGSLTFVSSRAIGDGKVEVIVENRSRGRVRAERLSMTIGGKEITDFTGKKNSIMPGQRRRFTFEHPKRVTARDVTFNYR